MKRGKNLAGGTVFAAIAIIAMVAPRCVSAANSASAECAGSLVTFKNNSSSAIWLGEEVQGAGNIVVPPSGWELPKGHETALCLPTNWISGAFWPRTECNFSGTFGQDPDYKSCFSASDCSQTPNAHICYGGKCVIDCSTSSGTNGDCSSLAKSVCVAAPGTVVPNYTAGSFCGFSGGVCKTGDCGSGLYECEGAWDSLTAQFGPAPPASQFEITDQNSAPNYDVSHVAGYNLSVVVTPPAAQVGGTCQPSGCVSDLNASCPSLLQVTEPAGATGSIPCGVGTFCQTGSCIAEASTCVIGCNDPADQCTASNPPGLMCNTAIPSPLPAGAFGSPLPTPLPTPDGSTYLDMYLGNNHSGNANSNKNFSMFSGNQGTPTCWGTADCAPGETCLLGSNSGISGFPSNFGICVGAGNSVQEQTNCHSTGDEGNDCGGYPTAGVYTCVASSVTSLGVACVPAFNPPIVGLGSLSNANLFTGLAAPLNPEWLAAAIVAGGGTTPYYEAFTAACPNQYAWVYDDHSGGFACASLPAAFTVAFGALSGPPSASATPSATPTVTATNTATATATASSTPTPTASPTSTVTATNTATPTATATATASATATSTATPTATSSAGTPTATPTATATATGTFTATATATATVTATATPTITATPTPSGTATPQCSPSFLYLTTTPAGTLAFGDVKVGKSVSQTLTVMNGEPSGALKLKWKIQSGNATDFSVTGGTCTTSKTLPAHQPCTYLLQLKGKKSTLGAVNTMFTVTGTYRPDTCPAGNVQNVTVTLAGNVTK